MVHGLLYDTFEKQNTKSFKSHGLMAFRLHAKKKVTIQDPATTIIRDLAPTTTYMFTVRAGQPTR